MYPKLDSVFLHKLCCLLQLLWIWIVAFSLFVIGSYGVRKVFVDATHIALHEWGSQVIYYSCIAAAFCRHCFADIACGVDIEVRHCSYKAVAPVAAAEGNLFAWSKFK